MPERRPPVPGVASDRMLRVAACVVAGMVVYLSWVPFRGVPLGFEAAVDEFWSRMRHPSRPGRTDFAANVVAFVVLGFVWLGAVRSVRVPAWLRGALVLVAATSLSVFVEFAQVWFESRVPSPYDIGAHVVGTVIGLVGWWCLGRRLFPAEAALGTGPRTGVESGWDFERRVLAMVVLGLLALGWFPLDVAIRPSEVYRRLAEGHVRWVPWPRRWDVDTLVDLFQTTLTFLPLGWFWRRSFPRGGAAGVLEAGVVGGLVSLVIECGQVFVLSRTPDVMDVVTGAVGAVAGAWLAGTSLVGTSLVEASREGVELGGTAGRASPVLRVAVLVLYAVIVLGLSWMPFEWLRDRVAIKSRFETLLYGPPLASFEWTSAAAAGFGFVRTAVLFAPLGVLMGWVAQSLGLRGTAAMVVVSVVSFGLAWLAESGQVLSASRTPDSFDALLACGSMLAGYAVCRPRDV